MGASPLSGRQVHCTLPSSFWTCRALFVQPAANVQKLLCSPEWALLKYSGKKTGVTRVRGNFCHLLTQLMNARWGPITKTLLLRMRKNIRPLREGANKLERGSGVLFERIFFYHDHRGVSFSWEPSLGVGLKGTTTGKPQFLRFRNFKTRPTFVRIAEGACQCQEKQSLWIPGKPLSFEGKPSPCPFWFVKCDSLKARQMGIPGKVERRNLKAKACFPVGMCQVPVDTERGCCKSVPKLLLQRIWEPFCYAFGKDVLCCPPKNRTKHKTPHSTRFCHLAIRPQPWDTGRWDARLTFRFWPGNPLKTRKKKRWIPPEEGLYQPSFWIKPDGNLGTNTPCATCGFAYIRYISSCQLELLSPATETREGALS